MTGSAELHHHRQFVGMAGEAGDFSLQSPPQEPEQAPRRSTMASEHQHHEWGWLERWRASSHTSRSPSEQARCSLTLASEQQSPQEPMAFICVGELAVAPQWLVTTGVDNCVFHWSRASFEQHQCQLGWLERLDASSPTQKPPKWPVKANWMLTGVAEHQQQHLGWLGSSSAWGGSKMTKFAGCHDCDGC